MMGTYREVGCGSLRRFTHVQGLGCLAGDLAKTGDGGFRVQALGFLSKGLEGLYEGFRASGV